MRKQLFEGDDVVVSEKLGEFSVWTTKNGEPLLTSADTESMNHMRALACNSQYVIVCTSKDWLKSVLSRPLVTLPDWLACIPLGQRFRGKHGTAAFQYAWSGWQKVIPCRLEKRQASQRSVFVCVCVHRSHFGWNRLCVQESIHVPEWTAVQSAFGLMSHRAIKGPTSLDGIFQIDSYPIIAGLIRLKLLAVV